jgi:tRNA-specific 2-thiouridylase
MEQREKVVVAMSGGVDSSVAAVMLREQGFDVVGIMLRLWSEPGKEHENRCCTPDSLAIARRVAARFSIPFYAVDAQEVFYNTVVKSFIHGYTHNATPNPCLICNQQIRWGFLLQHTLALNAQFLATGHYVRLRQDDSGKIQLLRATDKNKDQSYVLHTLNQHHLKHTLFPLGELTKPEVRELARKFNIPSAERPDSQDLCFLGNTDYRQFIAKYVQYPINPGPIFSSSGERIGNHPGLAYFTIGQRKGLAVSSPQPLYVLEKDASQNALIVGTEDELGGCELIAEDSNWISGTAPDKPFRAQVKIRYKAIPEWAEVHPQPNKQTRIHFEKSVRDITPGQAAVIYQDEICLGGGIIN